jgi:hypothetical protein
MQTKISQIKPNETDTIVKQPKHLIIETLFWLFSILCLIFCATFDFILCRSTNNEYYIQRLLLGTHTSGEQNHVMIAEVKLPLDDTPIDPRKYDDQRGGPFLFFSLFPYKWKNTITKRVTKHMRCYLMWAEVGGYQAIPGKVEIKQSINHDGDVNRYHLSFVTSLSFSQYLHFFTLFKLFTSHFIVFSSLKHLFLSFYSLSFTHTHTHTHTH